MRIRMKKIMNEDKGYVLISTLFFLMLSGLFSQSMIQISSNYVIQLRQVSTAYEAKAALTMCGEIVVKEQEGQSKPVKGTISTSVGEVNIQSKKQAEQIISQLTLIKENGDVYTKEVSTPITQLEK